jgi:exosortase/archaeosortase family protein
VLPRDPLARFFALAVGLYAAWYLLYELAIHPWGGLDRLVIDNLAWIAGGILELLGFELLPSPAFDNNRYLGVQRGTHLWIGDACDGVGLFAVFAIFMFAFPGPRRHKPWFTALGILSIHLINALRVAVLCYITTINYEWLTFNHDYTFYVVVYGWVIGLWLWWLLRFVRTPKASPAS